jgi:1,4-alpha-glucan branching enzyme
MRAGDVSAMGEGDAEASVDVTFRVQAAGATTVALVGDFNGWSPTATIMQRDGDEFTAVVPLATDRAYRYKFLVDGTDWQNDPAADDYVENVFGGYDSLRRL